MLKSGSGNAGSLYFLRRYIEEMVLAQTARDEQERSVHLQACRYYGDILHMNGDEESEQAEPRTRRL
jgi:hypothetical protein